EVFFQEVFFQERPVLDGKLFVGRMREKGIWGVFSGKGTLEFEQGKLIWRAGEADKDYLPTTYTTKLAGNKIIFSALMFGKNGDQLSWSGKYDGKNLFDVTAKWKRQKGDWVHDTLLPDVVTMVFKTKTMVNKD
ncbi:MAG: hypothetical protein OQJ89_16505, partial [Kangiellaceae bacterium]|nr:hypothetical protein [Kangiellaceae bacterium]